MLALLKLIAGRESSSEKGPGDAARKEKVEKWRQWWEDEGRHQKIDLSALKETFEAYRSALQ